jgi:hypothetical protein
MLVVDGSRPDQTPRAVLWLFMGILVVLVCVLAGLQYYWIGEISSTEQSGCKTTCRRSEKLGSDFSAEITTPPPRSSQTTRVRIWSRKAYEMRYAAWRSSTRTALFRRMLW